MRRYLLISVNDPIDPGGETKYGISKRSYPHEDIKHLNLKRAAWLYEQDFWNPLHQVCNHLNGRGRDYPVDGRLTSETIRWLNFHTAEKSHSNKGPAAFTR